MCGILGRKNINTQNLYDAVIMTESHARIHPVRIVNKEQHQMVGTLKSIQ